MTWLTRRRAFRGWGCGHSSLGFEAAEDPPDLSAVLILGTGYTRAGVLYEVAA